MCSRFPVRSFVHVFCPPCVRSHTHSNPFHPPPLHPHLHHSLFGASPLPQPLCQCRATSTTARHNGVQWRACRTRHIGTRTPRGTRPIARAAPREAARGFKLTPAAARCTVLHIIPSVTWKALAACLRIPASFNPAQNGGIADKTKRR